MRKKNKEDVTKELNDDCAVRACAEQFDMVGDVTRMKICWLLCKHKELSVGDIADMLNVSISTVSHALKKLKKGDMVESRQEHRHVYYQLCDNSFTGFLRRRVASPYRK